jgi:hypothetical protein
MEDIPTLSAEQERRIHNLEAARATARAATQVEIARLHEERIRALEAAQAARDAAVARKGRAHSRRAGSNGEARSQAAHAPQRVPTGRGGGSDDGRLSARAR